MASHNILSKTDRALVAYLVSLGGDAGTAADIFPAKRSLDKDLPCTVCYSERAKPLQPYSGVYEVAASIMIKTDPCIDTGDAETDPKDVSEARVGETFDAFFANSTTEQSGQTLAADITSAARAGGDADLGDYTVQDITVLGAEATFNEKGNAWVDTLNLELVVCPNDVS